MLHIIDVRHPFLIFRSKAPMYINIFPVQIYTADKAMDKLPLFVQRPIVQNIFRPDQSSPGSIQALGGRLLYGLRQGGFHAVNFRLELRHTVSDHRGRQSTAHLIQVQDTTHLPPQIFQVLLQRSPALGGILALLRPGHRQLKRRRVKRQLPNLALYNSVQLRHRPAVIPAVWVADHVLCGFCPRVPSPPEERLRLVQFSERPGAMLLTVTPHNMLTIQSLHHELLPAILHNPVEVDGLALCVYHFHDLYPLYKILKVIGANRHPI